MKIVQSRKNYVWLLIFGLICIFSNSAEAKIAAGSRSAFKNAMETFGEFIDSGAPFSLAEFFSLDAIPMPQLVKDALKKVIVVERSFDISLKDQTAVLKFAVELFGQKLIAKLRMGLEYPGPPPKKVARQMRRGLQHGQEILISMDVMQLAKTGVAEPIRPQLGVKQPTFQKEPVEQTTITQEGPVFYEQIIQKKPTVVEELIEEQKPVLPQTEKEPEIELIVSPPEKKSDLELPMPIIPERGDKNGDEQGQREEPPVQPKPVLQETDEFSQAEGQLEPTEESISEPTVIAGSQAAVKTKEEIKKLRDNAIAQIKSVTPKFSLLIGLPNEFKFGAIDSRLKFLDTIQFFKSAIIISQTGYYEPEFGAAIGRGLNIVGNVKIAGKLERLTNLVGQDLTTLTVHGLIDPAIYGSRLSAILPGKINFGKNIKTTGLKLHLYLKEVGLTVGIETGLEIKPPKQDDWLQFVGEINVAAEKASLEFNMRGMWENVFGIPGPKIGNVKFKATTDYAAAAATGGILTLSGIGFGGEMGIGSKSVEVNVYGEISETEDVLIEGIIKGGIFLDDIVSFMFTVVEASTETPLAVRLVRLSGKDPKEKLANFRKKIEESIPKLGFEKANISISPKVMFFSGKKYDGIEFDLITNLLNKKITMHMKLDKSGIEALGALSAIKIGPVTITGTGADKTKGTADDGPVASLAIKPAEGKATLFLNGRVEAYLFGKNIVSETLIDVSPLGVHGKLIQDIGIFKTELELSAKLEEPKDFFIKAYMEQEALDKLSELLEKGAKEMVDKANRDLSAAREKVKNAYQKLEEAKQKIKGLSEKRRAIEAENKARIARVREKIAPEVARYEQTKAELQDAVRECKGKAPKTAARDIDEKAAEGQVSALDEQRALNELKEMGLNENQIGAIRNQISK